jgi:F420H(2)-dependent quinone reductase
MGLVKNMMIKVHRRSGDRFMGMDLLYLTTVGARSGERRLYHNLTAHPDQVWVEVGGHSVRTAVEQLEGPRRAAAWERIVASQPRFGGYQRKTARALPVLRLSAASGTS